VAGGAAGRGRRRALRTLLRGPRAPCSWLAGPPVTAVAPSALSLPPLRMRPGARRAAGRPAMQSPQGACPQSCQGACPQLRHGCAAGVCPSLPQPPARWSSGTPRLCRRPPTVPARLAFVPPYHAPCSRTLGRLPEIEPEEPHTMPGHSPRAPQLTTLERAPERAPPPPPTSHRLTCDWALFPRTGSAPYAPHTCFLFLEWADERAG
jgi:hypothetical protein